MLHSTSPLNQRLSEHQRRILNLERAPITVTNRTTVIQVAKKSPNPPFIPFSPPSHPASTGTLLYAFDWRYDDGASPGNQPEDGNNAAMLRYSGSGWAVSEQPVLFFHGAGRSSRPWQIGEYSGRHLLSTDMQLAKGSGAGAAWEEVYSDELLARLYFTVDAGGRLWRATLPNSGTDITISRSDSGLGDEWDDIATVGNYYGILGMVAHPTDADMVAVLADDNDSDLPSIIITDDATAFTAFALPASDFSFTNNPNDGVAGGLRFLSDGRLVAFYLFADSGVVQHVVSAYSDDPTNSGSYTAVDILSAYNNDDGEIRPMAVDYSDGKLFVMFIREKLSNYRPAVRIAYSDDGAETWTEIDNSWEAPDIGVYSEHDYLAHPGGIRYFASDGTLWVFFQPYEADSPYGGSFDLAWKATTPLATPAWTEQWTAIKTTTGLETPAFAWDAVSHG